MDDFLDHNKSNNLYLVGDIIDHWYLKRKNIDWLDCPVEHDDIYDRFSSRSENGTNVILIPGNHDERIRKKYHKHQKETHHKNEDEDDGIISSENSSAPVDDKRFRYSGVPAELQYVHITAQGKKILITHGDQFDGMMHFHPVLVHVGDISYSFSLAANNALNHLRSKFGLSYWSLAAFLKQRVKSAGEYIEKFETLAAEEAKKLGLDGVVCGHIHQAKLGRNIGGVLYFNCGTWVDKVSCTAIVEEHDGRMGLMHWATHRHEYIADPSSLPLYDWEDFIKQTDAFPTVPSSKHSALGEPRAPALT